MADPFEVRMRFTNQLRQLNASVNSAQKAAQYALKYRDSAEDLHSCILEQLERNSMNTRANIMYFIEHFLDMAHKEGHDEYVRMMQRDIIRVVDAVAPEDRSGAANVKVVRKVLQALQHKSFLEGEAVRQIEEVLRERDTATQDIVMSSPPAGGHGGDRSDMPPSQTLAAAAAVAVPHRRGNAPPKLDKKQVEQRIEEDRERHKRQREDIWAVPSGDYAEMEKMWEETSDLGEDDHRMGEEEYQEWKLAAQNSCPHRREDAANGKHS
ncbi:CTD kinase subunit gamma CTK3-domain-containing protein [Lasiosphaeria miniovina]|uniref:CTD kinase subunit gamma CTK3-domain-containing protein n=1 Tax=Lasiosphaeria miniovina TaxID=1954250 RepID=A0AA40A4F2_9PEZI|nr:CTD kinase subunit gamma CTK3-domain-containing protein [Lasiosphaeria miniovina]KAK0709103.1 CTD kinase subunit gamma CTK3-domain-containing protein [Lasiosphaeria miniovina]